MKKNIIVLILFVLSHLAVAQTFNFTTLNFPHQTYIATIPFADFGNGDSDLADIDGDGDLDIVISRRFNATQVKVFVNDGNGQMTFSQDFSLHGGPYDVKFVDWNTDGHPDLVIQSGHIIPRKVLDIFINDGTGHFNLQHTIPDTAVHFKTGDFNQDGLPDLVTEDHIYLNDQQNGFSSILISISNPEDVIDFNNDSYPDVFSYDTQGNSVIYINDHNNGFTSHSIQGISNQDIYKMADLNNDQIPEIITFNSNGLYIFQQQNNYTFQQIFHLDEILDSSVIGISAIVVSDINQDNLPDIVISNNDANSGIYLNTSNLHFIKKNIYDVDSAVSYTKRSMSIGDINGDNLKDIIMILSENTHVLINNTDNFRLAGVNKIPTTINGTSLTADVDGDNLKDLFISGSSKGHIANIYKNNGNGYDAVPIAQFEGVDTSLAAFFDADNDGDNDLIIYGTNANNFKINFYKNDGAGHFTLTPTTLFNNNTNYIYNKVSNLFVADIDNDNDMDVIFSNPHLHLSIFINDGSGNFTEYTGHSLYGTYRYFFLFDIDNDGLLDIFTADNHSRKKVYKNNGNLNFTEHQFFSELDRYFDICFPIDLNNDNYKDLVYVCSDDESLSRVFLNDGQGHFDYAPENQSAKNIKIDDFDGLFTDHFYNSYEKISQVIDFDNDGREDWFAIANNNPSYSHKVLYKNIDGTLYKLNDNTFNTPHYNQSKNIYFATDYNNDGLFDVIEPKNPSLNATELELIINNGYSNNPVLVEGNTIFYCYEPSNSTINFIDLIDGYFSTANNAFYTTLSDAQNQQNEIPANYNIDLTNTTNFNFFVRTNTNPANIISTTFEFHAGPQFDFLDESICLDSYSSTYDLYLPSEVQNLPFGVYYEKRFYLNQSDAENYVNSIGQNISLQVDVPQEIWVRVTDPQSGCYTIKNATFVYHKSMQFNFTGQAVCDVDDDGTEIFDLTTAVNGIIMIGSGGYEMHFYLSENDALANINPIPNNTITLLDSQYQTIWAVGTKLDNGCRTIHSAEFTLSHCSYQYNVQQIPYSIYNLPQSTPPTVNNDDSFSAGIQMNYDFDFFGSPCSQLAIGSNGNISFTPSDFSQYDPWEINNTPIPTIDLPQNNIFGVYQDIDNLSNTNSTMAYGYIGTAPFRKFVTFYDNVPLYGCNSTTMTSQIVLYETYNFIDVQVDERTPCSTWNNGNGVIGIQNADASLAFYPPNRNVGNWTADDEAWRFRPTSTFPHFQYILCDANLDGVETFDTNVILTHFAATGQTVSIHLTKDDADNNVNPVTGNYNNITNAQTLFVRIDDGTNYVIKHVLLAAIDCNADYDIDGVPTNTEDLNANGNYGDDDTDGDGIPDFVDDDDDGDMILTNYELVISRPNNRTINSFADTDGDGIPNYLDDDDDGDGTPTIDEDYDGDGNPANDDTNNNGIPDYLDDQVNSISQLPDSAISMYPNPAKDVLNISANIEIKYMTVSIYAPNGKLIKTYHLNNLTNTQITMPKVKGLYLVRIQTDKGTMQKVVIKE